MKKVLSIVLCLVLALTLFAGCAGTPAADPSTPASVEGGKWGCAVPNATNSFYATCVAGVEDGIKEFDSTASIVVTDAAFDSGKQLDQVNDLILQGCKAIVLIPVDSNSIVPALDECEKAGIPVFVMDTPAAAHVAVKSTVVSNNYSAGEIAAKALVEGIDGKGKIVTITTTGSEAINQRKQALYDVLKEYPNIEIVQEEIVQNGTADEALTIMENVISSVPDVAGVFTTGDVFAIAICAALQANGYENGAVSVTSVDGTQSAVDLIKAGQLYATAAQLPRELGKQCVKSGMAFLKGETVEELINLDCLCVYSKNCETYVGF